MHSIEAFYFGAENKLFGMYTPADGIPKQHGVLICQPLLQEFYKSHFALRRIAFDLAQKGYDVLRFDYTGTGDSHGEASQVGCWERDVRIAMDELKDLSGSTKSSIVAVRFAAALLSRIEEPIDTLALWDPILDGNQYLLTARDSQSRLIQKHRELSDKERERFSNQELLGKKFDATMTASLENHKARTPMADKVHTVLSAGREMEGLQTQSSISNIESDCPWEHADLRMLYPHDAIAALEAAL